MYSNSETYYKEFLCGVYSLTDINVSLSSGNYRQAKKYLFTSSIVSSVEFVDKYFRHVYSSAEFVNKYFPACL